MLCCLNQYQQKISFTVSDVPLEERYYVWGSQRIQVPKQFLNQNLGVNISETSLDKNIHSENSINMSCWEATVFRKKSVHNQVGFFQPVSRFVYDMEKEHTKIKVLKHRRPRSEHHRSLSWAGSSEGLWRWRIWVTVTATSYTCYRKGQLLNTRRPAQQPGTRSSPTAAD